MLWITVVPVIIDAYERRNLIKMAVVLSSNDIFYYLLVTYSAAVYCIIELALVQHTDPSSDIFRGHSRPGHFAPRSLGLFPSDFNFSAFHIGVSHS